MAITAVGTDTGTVNVPIFARWNGKEYPIGDLTLNVEYVDGQAKLPSADEIVALIHEGTR